LEGLERREMFSVSEPNNTPDTAVVVPSIYVDEQYYATDAVSSTGDKDDYFKFYNLYGASQLHAVLYGLSADADLYVYDGSNHLLGTSMHGSNLSEQVDVNLPAHDYYYVRVTGYSGSTNYSLLLQNDYAGATAATARDVGSLWGQSSSDFWAYGQTTYTDYMDYRDNVDLVKFHMDAPGTISVRRLPNSQAPDTSTLVNTTQLLDSSMSVLANAVDSNSAQNIDRFTVPAGDYFVKFAQQSGAGNYRFRITADYAGDITGTARDLGDVTGSSREVHDMVGGPFLPTYEDGRDLYRVTLNQTAPVDIRLTLDQGATPPTFDADLALARDLNGNGFISPDEMLFTSRQTGDDSTSTTLAAGTYHVVVDQHGAYTSYQVDLDSDFDSNASDPKPYSYMGQAVDLGALVGEKYIDGGFGISAGDFTDFYKFQMSAPGRLTASAYDNPFYSQETTPPYLTVIQDLNGNNRYDVGEEVTPGAAGAIDVNLPAGTYFLRTSGTGQQAAYYGRMVADYAGNTLGDARPTAVISGPAPADQVFEDYIEQDFGPGSDVDDYYHVALSSAYQATFTTTGVDGEDLSLSLIQDANGNGVADPEEVLASSDALNSPAETVSAALETGDYFVRVSGVNGSTNYQLTMNFAGGTPGLAADFNGDGAVDGFDFLAWQRGLGKPADVAVADGDANGDHQVDGADLGVWRDEFVAGEAPVAAATTAGFQPYSMAALMASGTPASESEDEPIVDRSLVLDNPAPVVSNGRISELSFATTPAGSKALEQALPEHSAWDEAFNEWGRLRRGGRLLSRWA
jgi:hypothetical protein